MSSFSSACEMTNRDLTNSISASEVVFISNIFPTSPKIVLRSCFRSSSTWIRKLDSYKGLEAITYKDEHKIPPSVINMISQRFLYKMLQFLVKADLSSSTDMIGIGGCR